MKNNLYKISLLSISQFFLALLVLSININGANFFHTKELFFIFFVFSSFRFAQYRRLKTLGIMLIIYFNSAIFNLLTDDTYQLGPALYFVMGFIYLYLEAFETKDYRKIFIKFFLISSFFVSLISIFIWILCMLSKPISIALELYFKNMNSGNAAFVFMIENRSILGFQFTRVYYCTTPCEVTALGYCVFKNLYKRNSKYQLLTIFYSLSLLLSGARANILAVLLILLTATCLKLLKKKMLATMFLLILIVFLFGVSLLILLMSEKTDSSIKVKALHKVSYFQVFREHPIKTIFWGWGAGSQFFSRGYGCMTNTTELTLYETIRRYGVLSTIVMFLYIFGKEIIFVFKYKISLYMKIMFCIIEIGYILVACTNPFLFGSMGFLTLCFLNSFINEYNELIYLKRMK